MAMPAKPTDDAVDRRLDLFLLAFEYRMHRLDHHRRVFANQVAKWVAYRLSRRVVYWAAIRLGAHASTGKWSTTMATDMTFFDALERWDDQ